MDEVGPTYEALMRWIDHSGYRLVGASRELYRAWCPDDHSQSVTEIQLPIDRS